MVLSIVVVEDEESLREEICEFLQISGIDATGLPDGADLFACLDSAHYDAVVLDINLPGEDGFRLAPRLRQRPGLGVVMVTSRAGLDDRVRGLKIGADAYLVKPIDLLELVATLESVCRRIQEGSGTSSFLPVSFSPSPSPSGGWKLSALGCHLIAPNGKTVTLTTTEHDLLKKLSATPGQPVSRVIILGKSSRCKLATAELRKLDAVVRRLRRKVEQEAELSLPIRAVHGIGYTLMEVFSSDTPKNPKKTTD